MYISSACLEKNKFCCPKYSFVAYPTFCCHPFAFVGTLKLIFIVTSTPSMTRPSRREHSSWWKWEAESLRCFLQCSASTVLLGVNFAFVFVFAVFCPFPSLPPSLQCIPVFNCICIWAFGAHCSSFSSFSSSVFFSVNATPDCCSHDRRQQRRPQYSRSSYLDGDPVEQGTAVWFCMEGDGGEVVVWGANVTGWVLPIAHHSFAKH